MKQEIKNIILAVNAEDTKEAMKSLSSALSDKMTSASEAKKIAVAKSIYGAK
jgi:hypothetical protein